MSDTNLSLAFAVAVVLGNAIYLYVAGPRFAAKYPGAKVPGNSSLAWGALVSGIAALYVATFIPSGSGSLLHPWWGSGAVGALTATVSLGWLALLVDVRIRRLPTRLTEVMAAESFAAWLLAYALAGPSLEGLIAPFLGALVWYLPFAIGGGRGTGKGDRRLAPVLGFGLGTVSVPAALVGLVIAFLLAGAVALRLRFSGASKRDRFALGPFLLAGTWGAWAMAALVPLLAALQGVQS